MIVDDGHDSDSQNFTVNIQGLDDEAVISGDFTKTGDEDTTITGTVTATDVEGLADNSYFTVTSAPTNGSASIGVSSSNWTYTASSNYYGSDAFTITVTDDIGGTTTKQISLSVTNVKDPTVFSGDLQKKVLRITFLQERYKYLTMTG